LSDRAEFSRLALETTRVRVGFGDFVLDTDTRQLLRGRTEVHLSPKSLDLLAVLIESRPKALSKDRLQALLWPDSFVTEGNLSVLVSEIRRALDDNAQSARFVRTVPRFGYAFVGDTRSTQPGPAVSTVGSHWLIWGRLKFELVEGENIVGRDPHCEVHLDVPGVSRRHARLWVSAAEATVEDLGSKNGTMKDGRKLTAISSLTDKDELRFGPVAARYRYWRGLESTMSGPDLGNESID
jgi:DNA-binding winged helix-turn-helix (wHTH) protein